MEKPRIGEYKVTKGEFKGHIEYLVECFGDRKSFNFTLFKPEIGVSQEFTQEHWKEFKKKDGLKRIGPLPERIKKAFLETGTISFGGNIDI